MAGSGSAKIHDALLGLGFLTRARFRQPRWRELDALAGQRRARAWRQRRTLARAR
jgi:hypothetical protein